MKPLVSAMLSKSPIYISYSVLICMFIFLSTSCTSYKIEPTQNVISPLLECDIDKLMSSNYIVKTTTNERTNINNVLQQSLFIPSRRNFRNVNGKNVVTLAINLNDYDLAKKLTTRIDPQLLAFPDNCGNTALMYIPISKLTEEEKETLLSLLMERGLNPSMQNKIGKTALMIAAEYGNSLASVETLVKNNKVDLTREDPEENTAWDLLQTNKMLRNTKATDYLSFSSFHRYINRIKESKTLRVGISKIFVQDMQAESNEINAKRFFTFLQFTRGSHNFLDEIISVVNVHVQNSRQQNALFYTVKNVYGPESIIPLLKKLVEAGIDINHTDENGNTALMYALRLNVNPSVITALLNLGIDPSIRNNDENHALFYTAFYYTEAARIAPQLIKSGLSADDVNYKQETPLILSAKGINAASESTIRLFMRNSSNIEQTDSEGNNLFHLLLPTIEDTAFFDIFLRNPDFFLQENNQGITPVHLSAKYAYSSTKFFRKIVSEAGKLVLDLRDNEDRTPLFYAAEHNMNPDIVSYLLEYGADSQALDSNGNNVLMYAVKNIHSIKIAKRVLSFTRDINETNYHGTTALMVAAQHSPFPELIALLIQKGAILNAKNDEGKTSLMFSVWNQHTPDTTEQLIELGADINTLDLYGRSAILYAAKDSIYIEHVFLLLGSNADRFISDSENKTFEDYIKSNPFLAGYSL